MTEAVLARKQIKELALDQPFATLAAPLAEFTRLPEHLFMRNGPGNRRDRNRKNEERNDLNGQTGHDRLVTTTSTGRASCF